MKKLFFVFILFILALSMNAQKCAVLEFRGAVSVSVSDIDGISEMFMTYFRPAGYAMVERAQIDKVISEQGFQRSLLTDDQMVRLGRILNASKVVVGAVSMLGGKYQVDVRVVDVELGHDIACEGATFTGDYRTNVRNLATKLAGQIAITPAKTVYATPNQPSSSTNPRKRNSVEVLYGYLKIFPNELGTFSAEPTSVISQINAQAMHGYNNWRVPTNEELALMRANNYLGDKAYMTKENNQGVVLLVTDGKDYATLQAEKQRIAEEQERQRIAEEQEEQRIAEEQERQRIAEEQERQRIVEEQERQRIAEEQERKTALTAQRLNPEGLVFNVNGVTFTMKPIEGGTFLMGVQRKDPTESNYEEDFISPNAQGVHEVWISNFYMGETEVTQALWKAVMGTVPAPQEGNYFPVGGVSWFDCQKFIQELNRLTGKQFRLPTEAEWEYAARGGQKNVGCKYAGSFSIDKVAWYNGNSDNRSHPVKMKRPNELGLYDMSGNVLEWCQDWYFWNYYKDSPKDNPVATDAPDEKQKHRVLRGGSYCQETGCSRVANRWNNDPQSIFANYGLRLVLSP